MITDSAKKKFDFDSFENKYPLDADLALFKIIVDFAINKDLNIIAAELHSQLLIAGFIWQMEEINAFLKGKKEILKFEMCAAKLASDMLQNGNDPIIVCKSIKPLLEN